MIWIKDKFGKHARVRSLDSDRSVGAATRACSGSPVAVPFD